MPNGTIYKLADQVALPAGTPAAIIALPVRSSAGLMSLAVYEWAVLFVKLAITGTATVTFTVQGKVERDGDWFDLTCHELSAAVDETVQAASVAVSQSCCRALLGLTIPVQYLQVNVQLDGSGSAVLDACLRVTG